jgi:hypothetical protein
MRTFARVLFLVYVPLVVITAVAAFVDPPIGRDYTGIVSLMAAFAVGLPWSLIPALLHAGLRFANAFGRYEDAVLMWMFWVCSGPNVWLLIRWAFGKQRQIRAVESERIEDSGAHAGDQR